MTLPAVETVFGEVLVTDHERAVAWYAELFGREPDRRPMEGLAEWQLNAGGGLQVFEPAEGAGSSFVTLVVGTVAPVAAHLESAGVDADVQTVSSGFSVATVRDPDGNTITFAGSRVESSAAPD